MIRPGTSKNAHQLSDMKYKAITVFCVGYRESDEINRICNMMSLSSIKTSAQSLCFISFKCSMHNKGRRHSIPSIHCVKAYNSLFQVTVY